MNIYQFTVPGKAVPKARPRIGRGGHTYTPKTTQAYERRVRDAFNCAFPNHKPIQNPVRVMIQECRPMPTSWSIKQKQRMQGEPVTSKADLDNVVKAILDALNGVAFKDDSQIWNIQATKLWDYDGSVTVTIYESDTLIEKFKIKRYKMVARKRRTQDNEANKRKHHQGLGGTGRILRIV